jgi:hypothetical protein
MSCEGYWPKEGEVNPLVELLQLLLPVARSLWDVYCCGELSSA